MNWEQIDFTGLDTDFYQIDKEYFLENLPLKQRLSSAYIDYSIVNEKNFLEIATRHLTRIAYTMFAFVTNEKDPYINFNPSSNHSFCGLDKNIIQIGMKILAPDKRGWIPYQVKVDALIAIIYHEFLHKRFTIKDLKEIIKADEYYNNDFVTDCIKKMFPTKIHDNVHNILEDRRIEHLGSKELPGYFFYFYELRKYAYYMHSEKQISIEFPQGLILDYILIKILIPELESNYMAMMDKHESTLRQYLHQTKGAVLEQYVKHRDEFEQVRKTIYVIKEYIETHPNVYSELTTELIEETDNIVKLIPEDIQNRIEKELNKKIEFINISEQFGLQNVNDEGKKIDETVAIELMGIISDELKKIEAEKEANKNKAGKSTLEPINNNSEFSQFTHYQITEEPIGAVDEQLLTQAWQLSKSIANKLGFIESKYNRIIEEYELTEGDLDESEVYSLGFGNTHVFETIEPHPGFSLDFGILLDESWSMNTKMDEAKLATLALTLGLKDSKNINLFVYGHTSLFDVADKYVQIYKYYNTLDRFVDWKRLFQAKARSSNADGFAIEKVAEYMKKGKGQKKILIVVSDGWPNAKGYEGDAAIEHVRDVVQRLERNGIIVIQICMDRIKQSPKMFKHFVPFTKDGKFFDNLKSILLKQLNQFSDAI